jgi:hypothetical protein
MIRGSGRIARTSRTTWNGHLGREEPRRGFPNNFHTGLRPALGAPPRIPKPPPAKAIRQSPLTDSNRRPLPYHDAAGHVGRVVDPDLSCKHPFSRFGRRRLSGLLCGLRFPKSFHNRLFVAPDAHGDGSRAATASTSSRICAMTSAAESASRSITSRSAPSSVVSRRTVSAPAETSAT